MNTKNWISVKEQIPWLTTPPYFVATSDIACLQSKLQEMGFKVFEADGSASETHLLVSLGEALEFPDYYGANWAAFEDCVGDLLREGAGAMAVLIVGADRLMHSDIHAFVRSVHLLQDVVSEVQRAATGTFQFEVFFVGDFVG